MSFISFSGAGLYLLFIMVVASLVVRSYFVGFFLVGADFARRAIFTLWKTLIKLFLFCFSGLWKTFCYCSDVCLFVDSLTILFLLLDLFFIV
jgi:hypothetical protein